MASKQKVILYTTPTCFYCMMIKNFLVKNKVKFSVVDISKDAKKRDKIQKKTGFMSVPIVEVGKKVITGYDIGKIKGALKIK